MKGRELSRLLRDQQCRLRRSAPAEEISKIAEERRAPAEAVRTQSALRSDLEGLT